MKNIFLSLSTISFSSMIGQLSYAGPESLFHPNSSRMGIQTRIEPVHQRNCTAEREFMARACNVPLDGIGPPSGPVDPILCRRAQLVLNKCTGSLTRLPNGIVLYR